MSAANTAKNAARTALLEPLEALVSQTKPKAFIDEARREIIGNSFLFNKPREIASQDLARARNEEKIKEEKEKSEKESSEKSEEIKAKLEAYKDHRSENKATQNEMVQQLQELQQEVVGLAKASGIKTDIHLKNTPKVGKIDISFLTYIIKTLRVKAENSKSASDLVVSRQEAKSTGMLAWVSGKQMKIHEQGTLQLQG